MNLLTYLWWIINSFNRKMDPYVVVKFNGRTYKTRVHQSGGKQPRWGDEFELPVEALSDEVYFDVMDEDVGKDDRVGLAVIKVSALYNVDDWFTITYKGK